MPVCANDVSFSYQVHIIETMNYIKSEVSLLLSELLGQELKFVLSTSTNEYIMVSLYFSYMNLVLIVQLLWTLCLACQDIFSLRNNRDLHAPDFLLFFVIIDWVSRALCHCYCPCSCA